MLLLDFGRLLERELLLHAAVHRLAWPESARLLPAELEVFDWRREVRVLEGVGAGSVLEDSGEGAVLIVDDCVVWLVGGVVRSVVVGVAAEKFVAVLE